jgi:hypothetical protein
LAIPAATPTEARFPAGQGRRPQTTEEAIELRLSRFLEAEVKGSLVKVNGRVQPRVLEVGRAPPLDDRRVHLPFDHLPQDMLLQRVHQTRFAQARLADEQYNLAHAFVCLLPTIL